MRFLKWLSIRLELVKTNRDLWNLIYDIRSDAHTFRYASLERRQSATRLLRWNIESYASSPIAHNGAWLRSMVTLQNFVNGRSCSNDDLGLALWMLPLMNLEVKYTDFYEGCDQRHQEIEREAFARSM